MCTQKRDTERQRDKHRHTDSDTQTHRQTDKDTDTDVNTDTDTESQPEIIRRTHRRIHTYTHTHTQTHIHTQTHGSTYSPRLIRPERSAGPPLTTLAIVSAPSMLALNKTPTPHSGRRCTSCIPVSPSLPSRHLVTPSQHRESQHPRNLSFFRLLVCCNAKLPHHLSSREFKNASCAIGPRSVSNLNHPRNPRLEREIF